MEDLNKNNAGEEKKPGKERSYVFLYLASAYLIYNGYSLCSSFIQGEEGATLSFFLIGVVFIIIAIGVCAYAFINGTKQAKAKKEALEAEEKEEAEELTETKTKESGKMSIAQRARLAERLEEEESE